MRTITSAGLLLVIALAVWGSARPEGRAAVGTPEWSATALAPAYRLGQGRDLDAAIAARLPAPRAVVARPRAPSPAELAKVWKLADAYSARYGLDDPAVLRALIAAESEGNPKAVRRTAKEWSVGLLQVNLLGGRGSGYTEAELLDPEFNLAISMPEIAQAYRQARAEGYRGAELAVRVGELAQRPDADELWRYAAAYDAPGTGWRVVASTDADAGVAHRSD